MDNVAKRTRVAIIGLGSIARKVYLPLLSSHSDVEIVGLMNRSAGAVQDMQNLYRIERGTTDMEEVLSWDLDAVFVHTATEAHFDIVMQCLERGLSVYVDKPLSYSLRESNEMTAFAEAQGLLLAVGFNRRYAPLYRKVREWMAGGQGCDSVTVVKHRSGIHQRPAKETVYDDLIHMLDLLLWMTDHDYELLHHYIRKDDAGRLLHGAGAVRLSNTVYSTFDMVRQAGADLEKIELHGGGRSATVLNLDEATYMERGVLPQVETFGSWDSILYRRGFTGAVDDFLHGLDLPDDCLISASRVIDSHKLAEQVVC
ncbi:Gfo/Idh/MocA family protein [Paenibacillus lentus]|uniref:Gfo/Idh/MocA family oxidoreductase n=1 Tax=Paenibacillus lentus TaxID=1338368 RepID=A0A3Q8S5N3_9BACL|nr:Gfo/Idh/MocA family oxidoreductase [Paenibacillus lentus]AZK47554.1 gfo/Idh/MocA family oxidoreductase [Paenibacillus lentus]